ncbi:MAG: rhodanese-like domain-containing protein [Acidobacteria bacterium]|nr:rhodanese-like domain-containing protein [Acidobacteriota bacterium]
MRLFISKTIALGLCVCALVACSPQDGSAPAAANSRASTTNGNATAQTAKQPATQTADADTRRITIEETQAAIATGKAIIVDVRDEAAYKASHIKGAKSIPLPRFEERASELSKDKLIITYCA